MAANPPYPNIVQYGEATAVRHEYTQALYQAMQTALRQSYDLAQYDIAVRPCRDADNALYHCVSFTLKNQDPKQRGGKGNFAVQIRHSEWEFGFWLHRSCAFRNVIPAFMPRRGIGRDGLCHPGRVWRSHARGLDFTAARQVGSRPNIRAADVGFATQATRLKIRNLYFQTAFEQHSPQVGYPYPASLCRTTNAGSLKTGFPLQKTSDSGIRPATYRKAV